MNARDANVIATMATAVGDSVTAAVAQASGLTGAAASGLTLLLAEPGLGVDALSRATGLTGSGGVRLVDRLSDAGLAERRAGRDGRAVSLWLTPAGKSVARKVLQAREQVIARSVDALSAGDIRALARLAEKMLAGTTVDRDQAEWICRLCDLAACPQADCPVERAVS